MNIFSYNDLNEFNRILISILKLSDNNSECDLKQLINYCSSFILGGGWVDHKKIIKLCKRAGLLKLKNNLLQLTDLGKEFLIMNKEYDYEITEEQKFFISKNILFNGPWKNIIKSFLNNFSPNYSKLTYELSIIENPLPINYNSIIYLLKKLDILVEKKGIYFIDSKYVILARDLISEIKGLTDAGLEESIKKNKELSRLAEDAVLKFEKKRLKLLQCEAEAEIVRKISQLNVSAGYDIESFNNRKEFFEYDRFIEVKASQRENINFYWSINEYNIAKKMGNKYWIYYIPNFKSNLDDIIPIMIQNPTESIPKTKQLKMSISNYKIEQIEKVLLKSLNKPLIPGYLI